jgi:hypothetical protein
VLIGLFIDWLRGEAVEAETVFWTGLRDRGEVGEGGQRGTWPERTAAPR